MFLWKGEEAIFRAHVLRNSEALMQGRRAQKLGRSIWIILPLEAPPKNLE